MICRGGTAFRFFAVLTPAFSVEPTLLCSRSRRSFFLQVDDEDDLDAKDPTDDDDEEEDEDEDED